MKLLFLFVIWSCTFSSISQAEQLEIEQAIDSRGMTYASLSPNGKYIASVIFNGTNYGLVLYDTETLTPRLLTSGGRGRVGFYTYTKAPREITWVDNDLIAVNYGLVAETIDLQGKKGRELGEEVIGHAEPSVPTSPNLLVYTDVEDGDVALVNARTGIKTKFSTPRGKILRRAFDRHGQLRAVTLVNSAFWKDESIISNWYKKSANADWEKLAEFKITDEYWYPVYVPDEANQLIVTSRIDRDTYALFNYDIAQHALTEMLAGHPTQDILSFSGLEQSALERVVTGGMVPQQIWFDANWAAVQQAVDKALPNHINKLSGDPKGNVLIHSRSDTDPGSWYLFDTLNGTLKLFAHRKPSVSNATMRPMKIYSYKALDGKEIPAFLTLANDNAKPMPMVVLIHGGPTARDYWTWDEEVQILAAHGYAVFQPQFRGSTGFGRRFEEAGFGQWGRAMQDDITAGVNDLIAQGVADPARICIVGASYGGYAALWGLVKTPDLYQCGVSFAGVSDIEYMFHDGSDRVGQKTAREWMLNRIGDVNTEKAKFDEVSPLKHADKIHAPVLLIHGELDQRVPISHAEKMKDALERHGKKVEWLVLEDEGHGIFYTRNEFIYYNTLLAFLDKYIAPDKSNTVSEPSTPQPALATQNSDTAR
ncbi:alpha/beta hydrolase family protein [Undibacterium sp. MH2W]|uniref:alpha/beta hydrolase family protein n=1 Tax=Undibacterium sp. MH2W TaxID=3413044 RepID=UPI003BF2F85A